VIGFTKSLGKEVFQTQHSVNAVTADAVLTPIFAKPY
jgi:NAD(P)-dependent dehydrogenase (short-subunit alcohol dehydrogenase family)